MRAADPLQTIADGIAVKGPGEITGPLLDERLAGLVTVDEEPIAEAMVFLLERSKLLVEGAGAVGVAALMAGVVEPAPTGTTVAILSGGNIDLALVAALATRQETAAGRRVRLFTRLRDQPGGLAGLLAAIAEQNANLIQIEHVRDGIDLAVRETGVELTLETDGADHAEAPRRATWTERATRCGVVSDRLSTRRRAEAPRQRRALLGQLGRAVDLEVHAQERDPQRQPLQRVVAGRVAARVLVDRLDLAPRPPVARLDLAPRARAA